MTRDTHIVTLVTGVTAHLEGGALVTSLEAGDPGLVWGPGARPVSSLLLSPDLDTGLAVCLPSSILFITASHLLGFLTLGLLPLLFSSFSLSIALSLLPTLVFGLMGFCCSSSALLVASPGPEEVFLCLASALTFLEPRPRGERVEAVVTRLRLPTLPHRPLTSRSSRTTSIDGPVTSASGGEVMSAASDLSPGTETLSLASCD